MASTLTSSVHASRAPPRKQPPAREKKRDRRTSSRADSKQAQSKSDSENCRDLARSLLARMVCTDVKETKLRRGKLDPEPLGIPMLLCYEHTKESELLRTTLSAMFAGKEYHFRIATVLTMSSTGIGAVNSLISNTVLATNADFVALSNVFNEFFIDRFDMAWEPVSMYNYPLTGVAATSVSSLPIGLADLQHSQPTYGTITGAAENYRFAFENTARPFKYSWKNVEDPKSTVLPAATASATNTQSWALVTDIPNYTGSVQIISPPVPPPLPVSQVLGAFLCEWLVRFRVRA